jgi:ParB family chromosome partitioning protein
MAGVKEIRMRIEEIQVGKITDKEHNQRFEANEEDLSGLVSSISSDGLIEPIGVKEFEDGFAVVFGHKRLEACKRAGLEKVPCVLLEGNESQMRKLTFVENFFRSDLSPVELAVAIADEVKEERMTIQQLAFGFKKSVDWVRRQLAICGWPEEVLEGIHVGKISVAAASNLACITEDHYRQMLVRTACDNGVTARTTAAWLQAWRSMLPPAEAVKAEPVDGDAPATAMVPQAPCLVCHNVYRTDELCHVPLCSHCIKQLTEQR